jgi:hypothetical protein
MFGLNCYRISRKLYCKRCRNLCTNGYADLRSSRFRLEQLDILRHKVWKCCQQMYQQRLGINLHKGLLWDRLYSLPDSFAH